LQPAEDEGTPGFPLNYGLRIKQAIRRLQAEALHARLDEPSFDQIGKWIAQVEGREKPYVSATISSWIQERTQPSYEALAAMAIVFNCRDMSWIVANLPEARDSGRPWSWQWMHEGQHAGFRRASGTDLGFDVAPASEPAHHKALPPAVSHRVHPPAKQNAAASKRKRRRA